MSARPSTFTIGNFVLNYIGSRMQCASYKGDNLDNVTETSIHNAFTTGNSVEFEIFSNEVFDTIVDLDINHSMYELSIALTNAYFERINSYFNQYFRQGYTLHGQEILRLAIRTVQKWEDAHGYRIHKGTPYTFLGYTHLVTGNLDLAFTMLHDSVSQNTYTYPKLGRDYKLEAPSYLFATLNIDNPNNMLYGYVQQMKRKVEAIIEAHNLACGTAVPPFSYTKFHDKFLQRSSLESIVFYFVYTVMTILNLENWDKRLLANNSFSRLKQVSLLFDVSLVTDKTLSEKFGSKYVSGGVFDYLKQAEQIQEANAGALNLSFKYSNGKQFLISEEPIENVLSALLSNNITYRDGSTSYRMRAMLAAWNVRNFSAHNLTGIEKLLTTTPFENILNLLMSALFFSIEILP
jgi:hypothetical protein